jgi:hypothetical protein
MPARIAIILPLAAIVVLLFPCRSSGQVVATYQSGLTSAWGVEFDPVGNLYVSGRVGGQGFVRRSEFWEEAGRAGSGR